MRSWLREVITSSITGTPSTKRVLVLGSGITLMLCTSAVASGITRAIVLGRPVDAGAVAALGVLAGPLAILAGASYRKPESVSPSGEPAGGGTAPGTSLASASGPTAGSVGAADPGKPSVAP